MARIRTVKPEFFQHEGLASCSMGARLLAIALLGLADSEGRLRWVRMFVHGHAFPYEPDVDVESMANELAKADYLTRYEVDGKQYVEIRNFRKHQRISGTEASAPSQHPPPSLPEEAVECFQGKQSDASWKGKGKGKLEREEEEELEAKLSPREPAAGDDFDQLTAEAEFIQLWNSTTGTVRCQTNALPANLSREFRELYLQDGWLHRARDALSRFPLGFFQQGDGPPVPMTLRKFLTPTTVDEILAGVFDRRNGHAPKPKTQSPVPGAVAEKLRRNHK